MGRQLSIGNPPIAIELRRSTRARRLSLRVSKLDGRVSLTMPERGKVEEALAFLDEREGWLRKHLADVAPAQAVVIGGTIPLFGQEVPISAGSGRRAEFRGGEILVPPPTDKVAARIKALLKLHARDALAEASDRYAAQLGQRYERLSLRDTRSRWGSCSSAGVLMYSWRLVMAPPDVLDYVAAHEVAHLVEMNHSPAFWQIVAGLMPDYQVHRNWLRENGDRLHRVQFGN